MRPRKRLVQWVEELRVRQGGAEALRICYHRSVRLPDLTASSLFSLTSWLDGLQGAATLSLVT
jgi:hypothetical protein